MKRHSRRELSLGRTRVVHPYAWLWEPLEQEASFVRRSMFGTATVYLDGALKLCFAAKAEPWRGLLICTDRDKQPSLMAEFPQLQPHSVLPKWLYLPETCDAFEEVAQKLVRLVQRRDPRIGVVVGAKKRKLLAKRPMKRTRK